MTRRSFTQALMWNKKERKKKRKWRGETGVCRGKDRKKGNSKERAKMKAREQKERERERDKDGLNGDRK